MSVILTAFFLSCEKQVEEFSLNATDGKMGPIGYSSLVVKDPVSNSLIHFVDFNRDGKFTPDLGPKKDSVEVTELNSGQKIVPIAGTLCYNIIQVTGTTETPIGQLCSIKGDTGNTGNTGATGGNGHDAYNPVFSSSIVRNLSGDTIGYTLNVLWDIDRNGFVTDSDKLVHTTPMVKNGKDGHNGPMGPMGPMGPSPTFDWNIQTTETSVIYSVTVDGVTTSKSINKPVGQTGATGNTGATGATGGVGNTPSLIVTQSKDGAYYLWFDDKNHNGICDLGEKIIQYFQPLYGGNTIVSETHFTDFIGENSTAPYVANGWSFCNAGVSDGNAYIRGTGSITTPPMTNGLDLLSLTFMYGSKVSRTIKVVAIMQDGTEHLIMGLNVSGISDFQVNNYSQYKLAEYYESDLNNLQYQKVLKLRFEASGATGKSGSVNNSANCEISTDVIFRTLLANFKNTNVGQ